MALKGDLNDLALADLLSLLSQQNKSGYISVSNDKHKARLTLNRGDIVHVCLGNITPEKKITNALNASKRIQPAQLKELEQQAAITDNSALAMLVSKGILQKDECQSWIQIAAEELAMELVSWNRGKYQFQPKSTRLARKESSYFLKTDFIILEGLRQKDEWERLKQHLPPSKSVLKIAKKDYADYELGQDIYIMNAVNGRTTIRDLQTHLPFNSYRYFAGIKNLMKEGFLEAVKSQPFQNVNPTLFLAILHSHKKNWPVFLTVLALLASLAIRVSLRQWKNMPANPSQFETEKTIRALKKNWKIHREAFYGPAKQYAVVKKLRTPQEYRHAIAK